MAREAGKCTWEMKKKRKRDWRVYRESFKNVTKILPFIGFEEVKQMVKKDSSVPKYWDICPEMIDLVYSKSKLQI